MSTVLVSCGDGELWGDGGAEYPCVRRFRHRRLFTFLFLYGFEATAESMLDESDAVCSPLRLQQLVEDQRWRDAQSYLCRFLPPPVGTQRRPLSVEAHVIHNFLGVHAVLASIVAGVNEEAPTVYSQYLSHDRTVGYGAVWIRSIILSILYACHQVRTSIDWECVWTKAGKIIHGLVSRTPELKDVTFLPGNLMKPHNVLPIGFGFRRRRHPKKPTRRPRASALAKLYIRRQSLPAISDPSQEYCYEMTVSKALDWVADIVDECLKAGRRPESHPLQTSGMEGEQQVKNNDQSYALFSSSSLTSHVPTSSSLTSNSGNSGIGSIANAGELGSHVPTPSAPFLGNVCPPILQTVFGNLAIASDYGKSGAGLIPNTGPLAPVSQTMTLTNHAESSGAIAAPVSQTMSCSLAQPINHGMPLVANAGKLASHMLTPGAPLLGNMGASLSQNGFDSLTSHCENSGIALIENTGSTVSPVSQVTNLTSHSGDSGALVAPVSQNILGTLTDSSKTLGMTSVVNAVTNAGQPASLALTLGVPNLVTMFNAPASLNLVGCSTSAAKSSELSLLKNNAGGHVAPAVQAMNFANHAESSGINKNTGQVGCNGAHQGFSLRENSREDITTTRACGEAIPMPAIQT